MLQTTVLRLAAAALIIVLPGAGAAQETDRQAVRIDFERMHPLGDLRITGRSVTRTLTFELNRRWKPAAGSALHLVVQHSPHLDGDRSFLSIAVNYGIVRSVRLNDRNAAFTRIIVPIPPQLLARENTLQFVVEQHPGAAAPSADVWTTIGAASFVHIEGVRRPARMDLAELPDAFVEGTGPRHHVAVLRPEDASRATLEGTARLVATLAHELLPGHIDISVARSLMTAAPLLIVGTAGEHPLLARLHRLPLHVIEQSGRRMLRRHTGALLQDPEGVVGLAPGPAGYRVLFVTADSPEAVHRTATATLRAKTLAGAMATIVTDLPAERGAALRQWKGHLPPAPSFTLADLGRGNVPMGGDPDVPLVLPLDVTPDAHFFAYGHQVTLRLSINPAHFAPEARLRIEWNDVQLAEYVLADRLKGTSATLPVWVPAETLKARNVLKLRWVNSAADDGSAVVAWLLADSEFYLPRYHQAALPDLALLRERLYPFSLRPDLGDVVIVPPDRLSDAAFGALLQLAATFGTMAPADHVAFRVLRAGELTDRDRAASHLVVLHSEESPNGLTSLLAARRRLLWDESAKRHPVVQEMASPWNANGYVLALSAASDAGLRQLVASAFSASTLARLSGDAAYVTAEGPVPQRLAPTRTIGAYPYRVASEAWLRTHWAALPAILTLASGLFVVACRLGLRSRT